MPSRSARSLTNVARELLRPVAPRALCGGRRSRRPYVVGRKNGSGARQTGRAASLPPGSRVATSLTASATSLPHGIPIVVTRRRSAMGGVVEAHEWGRRAVMEPTLPVQRFGEAVVAGQNPGGISRPNRCGAVESSDEPRTGADQRRARGVGAKARDALHAGRGVGRSPENRAPGRAPGVGLAQLGGAGSAGKIIGGHDVDGAVGNAERRAVVRAEGQFPPGGGFDRRPRFPRDGRVVGAQTGDPNRGGQLRRQAMPWAAKADSSHSSRRAPKLPLRFARG